MTDTTEHADRAVDAAKGDRGDVHSVQSVEKALMIVELLMRHGEALSAREIALRIGINRTTGHRLLNSLMRRGWIEKVPDVAAYRVSLRHLVLSTLAYQQRDVLNAIAPTLERLAELSRETVHVGVLDGYEVVHVDKIDSPERVGMSSPIGTRAMAHLTALGKAILAASPDETVDAYIDFEHHYPFDARWLREDIQRTRSRGYSIDDEEDSPGVRCIGSAIVAGSGEPIFAISITGPSGRFTMEKAQDCAPALMAATEELSRDFGWSTAATKPAADD